VKKDLKNASSNGHHRILQTAPVNGPVTPDNYAPSVVTPGGTRGNDTALPTFDWSTKSSSIAFVKNQGHCGCCYAFGSTNAIEALAFIKTGQNLTLSPQQVIDCSTTIKYSNNGCNGGSTWNVYTYVQDWGITSEAIYPFISVNGTAGATCNYDNSTAVFKISGYTTVTSGSAAALLAAVNQQPVSVSIEADQPVFQQYGGGVISGDACGYKTDHAVLVVGYGYDSATGLNYLKLKNQWKPTWGENGFVRIAIDSPNALGTCAVLHKPAYPNP